MTKKICPSCGSVSKDIRLSTSRKFNPGPRCTDPWHPSNVIPTKNQTPSQRVANPVWLRQQIAKLITECDETIAEDRALLAKERDDQRRARYEASVDCHRYWKKQLERILTGKTDVEALADILIENGVVS